MKIERISGEEKYTLLEKENINFRIITANRSIFIIHATDNKKWKNNEAQSKKVSWPRSVCTQGSCEDWPLINEKTFFGNMIDANRD